MTIDSKVRSILTLKKHCKNWVGVILFAFIGRRPRIIFLRNGSIITQTNRNKRFPIFALSQLLEQGWTFKLLDDQFLDLHQGSVVIRSRYDRGFDVGHLVETNLIRKYSHFRLRCLQKAACKIS